MPTENTSPETGPLDIAKMAASVATHLTTHRSRKKHGGYLHYEDGLIEIQLDTYVPNISIALVMEGKQVPVFSASHHSWDRPSRYNPGAWTGHLEQLAERAAEAEKGQKEERQAAEALRRQDHFGPIDDAALFAGNTS